MPPVPQALFKSLSMRFRDRLAFAEVRDVKGAIAGMLDVTASPMLLVVPAKGDLIKYDGECSSQLGVYSKLCTMYQFAKVGRGLPPLLIIVGNYPQV